jgi:zinc dependent phospholipase C
MLAPRPAAAYSVLAHEACVDALWDASIRPLLLRRYPRATEADLNAARAYAYGGSVIQDLGYYPFGSHFFTNLVHYVRSGDFVETLIRDARDVNELAFAIGALAHYVTDNVGHPEGVNPSVPLMFPKLQQKFGDSVTYAESPSSHVAVEFSFDVVQAASGSYLPELYHRFIGFEVARPLLERSFKSVYGLELKELFTDDDLAIATYRRAVSELMPELTRVAWRDKREEIAQLKPGVTESAFVYKYTRQQYEREFGTGYLKPGFFGRVVGLLYRLLPKIGPLKPLRFKTPTPEAQKLFEESFKDARARYGAALGELSRASFDFRNTNFDTGEPIRRGTYKLADETYAELLDRHAQQHFAAMPRALRTNITTYYARGVEGEKERKDQKRVEKIREQLAEMASRH